jgi:hypothetical protein
MENSEQGNVSAGEIGSRKKWDLPSYGLSKYDHLRITSDTDIPVPTPIITINGETISTEGNITTLSGASKSGKSALTSFIIAGAISENGEVDGPLEGLLVEQNYQGKAVLQFDTEQARHKHQANLKSILRRAGRSECPNFYLSYNIRQLDITEYEPVTRAICELASEQHAGIHLIIIDGATDYISSVNAEEESNAAVKFFEELAIKYSAPVILIIHTNPNSDKERGHIGSQLQRKSESVLTIKTEGDISILEAKFLRMAGKDKVQAMQFKYDPLKGYHVGIGNKVPELANDKDTVRVGLIEKIALEVFAPPSSHSYNEAIERIMKVSRKGTTMAKGMFKEMKAHGMITQGEDGRWRYLPV